MVHETIDYFDENDLIANAQVQILLNFAYEIRKAYSGQRLTKKTTHEGDEHFITYYGFQVVWTDILIFSSTLRQNINGKNKLNLANLYMLEHMIEKALTDYDPKVDQISKTGT